MGQDEPAHDQRIALDGARLHAGVQQDAGVEAQALVAAHKPPRQEDSHAQQGEHAEDVAHQVVEIDQPRRRAGRRLPAVEQLEAGREALQQVGDIDQEVVAEAEEDEGVEDAQQAAGAEDRLLQGHLRQGGEHPPGDVAQGRRRPALADDLVDAPKAAQGQEADEKGRQRDENQFFDGCEQGRISLKREVQLLSEVELPASTKPPTSPRPLRTGLAWRRNGRR